MRWSEYEDLAVPKSDVEENRRRYICICVIKPHSVRINRTDAHIVGAPIIMQCKLVMNKE